MKMFLKVKWLKPAWESPSEKDTGTSKKSGDERKKNEARQLHMAHDIHTPPGGMFKHPFSGGR